ncbi:MAG: hypothetical protein IPP29_16240 [Bacteroidetes bacterium]|nr:hypothetical protein [Bacteroidota bacterium]
MSEIKYIHAELAAGPWFELSLMEQLGNVGSEVGRARKWQHKNQKIFENSFARAFELMWLTIEDPRWKGQLKELCRAKECLCDAYFGGILHGTTFESMEKYFHHFAVAARIEHEQRKS